MALAQIKVLLILHLKSPYADRTVSTRLESRHSAGKRESNWKGDQEHARGKVIPNPRGAKTVISAVKVSGIEVTD